MGLNLCVGFAVEIVVIRDGMVGVVDLRDVVMGREESTMEHNEL